jgi:hypothetical protein
MVTNGKVKTAERKPARSWETRDTAVSLCQPAVRLVLVEVSAGDDGETWHNVHPVVALLARVQQTFRSRGNSTRSGTARTLEDKGWQLSEQTAETVAVYLNEEGDLFLYPDPDSEYPSAYRLVPCPWPPDEDDRRLQPLVQKMVPLAVAILKHRESGDIPHHPGPVPRAVDGGP